MTTPEVRFGWIADIASIVIQGHLLGMKHSEERFVVEVTPADEVVCRVPGRPDQRISMSDLKAVHVETNDSGPWGADVWWILSDTSGETKVTFPQLATGENRVLDRLRLLPGFEVKGMNSAKNARFLCWSGMPST